MAEYLIQDSTLTSIGNEIRTLRSSSSKMTPATMTSNLKSANTEVNNQTTIMNQILAALETKGDGGLNFKVVGGDTAPGNPEENTIWINTSTPITSWEFSATQPIASSGKVWICVGTASSVEFNMLNENAAKMYPLYAKQYISGAWVDKVAKSWQNSKWVDWLVLIVSSTVDNTGGWSWYNAGSGASAVKNSDGSYTLTRGYASQHGYLFRTNNIFDLTDIKTLEFEILYHRYGSTPNTVGIVESIVSSATTVSAEKAITTTGIYPIDVSSYNGQYAIAANMDYNNGIITITNIKLLR